MTQEEIAVIRSLQGEVSALRGIVAWLLSVLAHDDVGVLLELETRLVDGMRESPPVSIPTICRRREAPSAGS